MLKILSRSCKKIPSFGLSSLPKYSFTVYSNQHQREYETINNNRVKYDANIMEYDKIVKAFLGKRWTTKEELPPKIYIIDPIEEIQDPLKQQKLVFMKKLYDLDRLKRMYEANELNSQYLMSITLEENFKNLCDEYLGKVLMNGQVVPMKRLDEYNEIVNKSRKIYHRFFYGDDLSEFEKDIETRYLVAKQGKYLKFMATEKPQYKCVWTYTQQKRMELLRNYISRDLKFYDDFRPVYEPLDLEPKLKNIYLSMDINKDGFKRKLFFQLFEKGYYERSRKRATFITQTLINRAMFYANSIEFTRVLDVPPDFHIEHSIANVHVWLMVDRLRKMDTVESKFMAKQMEYEFKRITLEKANQIHLRKKNDFINDVNHFMLNNRIAYDRHFNKNPKTSLRPYFKLDALVWSSVFFEKVPRYSDIVYLMSEYIIKHHEYMSTVDIEAFTKSDMQWDVYRIPVNYKDTLVSINVPLTEEELNQEINSDKKIKRHYYSYDDPEYELPINAETNNIVKRRFETVHYKMFEALRKYNSLDSYDFYTERDEKEKKETTQKEKYAIWSGSPSVNKMTPADEIKKKLHEKKNVK